MDSTSENEVEGNSWATPGGADPEVAADKNAGRAYVWLTEKWYESMVLRKSRSREPMYRAIQPQQRHMSEARWFSKPATAGG